MPVQNAQADCGAVCFKSTLRSLGFKVNEREKTQNDLSPSEQITQGFGGWIMNVACESSGCWFDCHENQCVVLCCTVQKTKMWKHMCHYSSLAVQWVVCVWKSAPDVLSLILACDQSDLSA